MSCVCDCPSGIVDALRDVRLAATGRVHADRVVTMPPQVTRWQTIRWVAPFASFTAGGTAQRACQFDGGGGRSNPLAQLTPLPTVSSRGGWGADVALVYVRDPEFAERGAILGQAAPAAP